MCLTASLAKLAESPEVLEVGRWAVEVIRQPSAFWAPQLSQPPARAADRQAGDGWPGPLLAAPHRLHGQPGQEWPQSHAAALPIRVFSS